MAGRRTNLVLLVVVPAALLTGGAAFATGAGAARLVTAVHGIVGLAVVLLVPWKSAIVRRGLSRDRRGKAVSIALGVVLVLTVGTGVLHATAGGRDVLRIHVGGGLVALPMLIAHAVARPQPVRGVRPDRRAVLLAGGSAAVWMAVEGTTEVLGLPGEDRRATGSYERGSGDPATMPVTQWLDDRVPRIDAGEWRLTIRSSGRERHLSLLELAALPSERVDAVLDCTGGWWSEQSWRGVRLDQLVGADAPGRSILVRSATGYRRRFPRRDADHLWLSTEVAERPLSPGHGLPARLVAPGRRGFWWVKWVDLVAVEDRPWWLQLPFPPT